MRQNKLLTRAERAELIRKIGQDLVFDEYRNCLHAITEPAWQSDERYTSNHFEYCLICGQYI